MAIVKIFCVLFCEIICSVILSMCFFANKVSSGLETAYTPQEHEGPPDKESQGLVVQPGFD